MTVSLINIIQYIIFQSASHEDPLSQSIIIGLFSIVGFLLFQPPSKVSNMKIHIPVYYYRIVFHSTRSTIPASFPSVQHENPLSQSTIIANIGLFSIAGEPVERHWDACMGAKAIWRAEHVYWRAWRAIWRAWKGWNWRAATKFIEGFEWSKLLEAVWGLGCRLCLHGSITRWTSYFGTLLGLPGLQILISLVGQRSALTPPLSRPKGLAGPMRLATKITS